MRLDYKGFRFLLVVAVVALAANCAHKPKSDADLAADIDRAVQKLDESAVRRFSVANGRLVDTDITDLSAKPTHEKAIICHEPLNSPIPFARCIGAWFGNNPNGCVKVWQDHGLGQWCASDNC
jgi:hypothetical protein